jgi:hypothetical protein
MIQLGNRYIPSNLCLIILSYCDVPDSQFHRDRIDPTQIVNAKAFSCLRVVCKWWYLCENLSRCRVCPGRYNYKHIGKKWYLQCNRCCHVYNRKSVKEMKYSPDKFMRQERRRIISEKLEVFFRRKLWMNRLDDNGSSIKYMDYWE